MSWWETGHGDDVIGDRPADILRRAFQTIADECQQLGQNRPTILQLLKAIAAVIRTQGGRILADAEPAAQARLVIKTDNDSALAVRVQDATTSECSAQALQAPLHTIAQVYAEHFRRKP